MAGKLIVIEGLDGAGKSTQLKLLSEKTESLNRDNSSTEIKFITFPDYDSFSGRIIKEYLSGAYSGLDTTDGSYSASCFYAVDRYISFKTNWGGDYIDGKNIISARYTGSNLIYQMAKLKGSQWDDYYNWLYDLEFEKLALPKPDATIFLDMPFEVSEQLLNKRYKENSGCRDMHESDLAFLKTCKRAADYAVIKDGWKKINCAKKNQDNLYVPREIEDINAELLKIVLETLKESAK